MLGGLAALAYKAGSAAFQLCELEQVTDLPDITLSAKVHLVKATVFPIVVYGCEIWTIKKTEC